MTTPTPAPMTAERLNELRCIAANLSLRSFEDTPASGAGMLLQELLAHIDALTARVATLEAELAEARKVEDGEVNAAIDRILAACYDPQDASQMPDAEDAGRITCGEIRGFANFLTRLSAALKEAERSRDGWKHDAGVYAANAQAAEAKLESARRDALEEAATHVERAANTPSETAATTQGRKESDN